MEELQQLSNLRMCVNGFYDISLVNLSISELVTTYRPLAAICRLSGVSIEMLKLGVPVILVGSNQYPMLNNIIGPSSDIPILFRTSEIIEELEKLKSSSNYQVSRIITGHRSFSVLVDQLGKDACELLSNISLTKNNCNISG